MILIIIGIIMLVAGGALGASGYNMSNDIGHKMNSFVYGTTNPGSIMLTVGIVVALVGVGLIVIGCIRKFNNKQ